MTATDSSQPPLLATPCRSEFKDWICGGQTLLPFEEWRAATNLYKIWGSYVSSTDPRWISTGGNVEKFIEYVYGWLQKNLDKFLDALWDSGFRHKDWRDIEVVSEIDGSTLANTSNNPGYFRGFCYRDVTVCGGDGDIKLNMRDSIIATLNGKVRKTFFAPATWQDIVDGILSSNIVLTFNKSCKLVSVFSPNVYRYLVRRMKSHGSGTADSILFATGSWGVPVVAARQCGYSEVNILDVQASVLDACHQIDSDYSDFGSALFHTEKPSLYTWCHPSETMHTVLPGKYDHIISCPPYYDLEMYGASELQSTMLYRTYEEWLEGYWRQTVLASMQVLNTGGVFAFIMGHHVRYKFMAKDMEEIATGCGLRLVDSVKILPKKKTKKLYHSPVEKYEICQYFTAGQ